MTKKIKKCSYKSRKVKHPKITKDIRKVTRKIDEGIFRRRKATAEERKLKTNYYRKVLEGKIKKEDVKVADERMRGLEIFERFLKNNSDGVITLPNGGVRSFRQIFDYADESLSKFDSIGTDQKANMEILNQNISFMIWRAVLFQTDLDTKDVLIKQETPRMTTLNRAFTNLINVATQNQFKNTGFGEYLNKVRRYALKYGKAISKVAGGKVEVIDWKDIVAYGWADKGDKPRIAHRITISLDEALERFKDTESFEMIQEEVNFLREQMINKISFIEYWDTHYIDGKYQDGAILFLNRGYLADLDDTVISSYDISPQEQVFIEVDRYIADYERIEHGKEITQRPFFELDFINPAENISRVGFGIPELVEAFQKEWTEKAHLKRKADRLAYKSVWIHKRGESGNMEETVRDQMKSGIETGALLEINQSEDLERLTIASPLENFLADVKYLENMALKVVGVAELRAGEESARKTATQVQAEVGREMSTMNYFIEQQGLMLEDMLMVYIKEVILKLTDKDIVMLFGDPKDIMAIRRMLFSVHYRENYKELNRKFKKITGETPWLSDIDNIYKALDKELVKVYGESSLPFKFKKWKKLIMQNLDFSIDVDITTENNIDRQLLDIYKYLLELAKGDPTIDKQKVVQKMIATLPNANDVNLFKSQETVKEEQDERILQNMKEQVAQQKVLQARQEQGQPAEMVDEGDVNTLTPEMQVNEQPQQQSVV